MVLRFFRRKKKRTTRRKTARKKTARRKTTRRKAKRRTVRRRTVRRRTRSSRRTKRKTRRKGKPFGGYQIMPDENLSRIIGKQPVSPSQMTKKVWSYIKRKRLSRR